MKKGGLGSRLLVAAWGIPLILGLTWLGGWWTVLLIAAIAFIAQYEYYELQGRQEQNPFRLLGLISGLLVVAAWMAGFEYIVWVISLTFLVVAFCAMAEGRPHQDILTTLGGVCYLPLLAGSFILIREWSGTPPFPAEGLGLTFCIWGALWIGDTTAYFGGKLLGKHKLAPRISPNKTIEGFLFGLAGAIFFCVAWWKLGLVRFDIGMAVGIAAGTFGQLGDLVESAIKRESGVKDSSSLLPGHGGVLDRFDSLFATAPVVALYLTVRPVVVTLF